jgi:hypothetical protein
MRSRSRAKGSDAPAEDGARGGLSPLYAPKLLELVFCELRLFAFLGSSPTVAECSEMEASLAPDEQVRLVLPLSNLLFINWALWTTEIALGRDEKWFSEISGVSLAQVRSLSDELKAVRYALEWSPRFVSRVTGELVSPLEPHKTDTAWDELPKMEAETLPGRQVALTLPQEKLAVFPGLLEASLVYVAPHRSESEENDFRGRFAASTEEAEALADELRRLNWKMQVKSHK